jgi:hypothetical protein
MTFLGTLSVFSEKEETKNVRNKQNRATIDILFEPVPCFCEYFSCRLDYVLRFLGKYPSTSLPPNDENGAYYHLFPVPVLARCQKELSRLSFPV